MKSIMQENDRCYLCRMAFGTETHHVFPGNPNRKHSEEDGLTVRLCLNCHWKVHFDSKDNGESMLKLKRDGQEAWERCYWKGDEETTRAAFIERYGRSVLCAVKIKNLLYLGMTLSWMRQRVCDMWEDDSTLAEIIKALDELQELVQEMAEEEDEQRANNQRADLVDDRRPGAGGEGDVADCSLRLL